MRPLYRNSLCCLLLGCLSYLPSQGQNGTAPTPKASKTWPIITALQFQNFGLPFYDLSSHFSHPGMVVGSELALNKKQTLLQQGFVGAYRNRDIGNGVSLYTQFCYRPSLMDDLYGEIKMGVGYAAVFNPVPTYTYHDGELQKVTRPKSQLLIPAEMALGYNFYGPKMDWAPYVAYQATPALFYNQTLPFNLYSNVLVGVRVKLHDPQL